MRKRWIWLVLMVTLALMLGLVLTGCVDTKTEFKPHDPPPPLFNDEGGCNGVDQSDIGGTSC